MEIVNLVQRQRLEADGFILKKKNAVIFGTAAAFNADIYNAPAVGLEWAHIYTIAGEDSSAADILLLAECEPTGSGYKLK